MRPSRRETFVVCVIAWILALAYLAAALWLVRRCHRATTAALQLAADCVEQAAFARAQLEQATQARRPLPEAIRSVALSYAAKARN